MDKSKFIFKIENKELDENIEISIFSVDEEKNTHLEKKHLNYSIYISTEEFEKLNIKSPKIITSEVDFHNKNKEKILKIDILNKELYEYILTQVKDNKFILYEADISFDTRYLIESDLS